MKLVDEAIIKVNAGKGGDGLVSFRREKYIPKGGPDGGNGGKGGGVILCASSAVNTLVNFRYQSHFKASNGNSGEGSNKTGLGGQDILIDVPLGTQVYDENYNYLIGELITDGTHLLVAKGGTGGMGNINYKSSINQSPRHKTQGGEGEYRELRLELTLLADVGLLGLPNAGKSSLLRKISRAQPKVGDYPFTTLYPHLGTVIPYPGLSFIVADIPGIIEGSSQGLGLGLKFLRHLKRTTLLLHLIDCLPVDESDPIDNMRKINQELLTFSSLNKKKQWIILNKIDLIPQDKREALVGKIKEVVGDQEMLCISAITGEGTDVLLQKLTDYIFNDL